MLLSYAERGGLFMNTAAEELRLQYEQMKGSGFPLNIVFDFGKSSVYAVWLSTTVIKSIDKAVRKAISLITAERFGKQT